MGEVWQAREARAIAALNHPRICQLYDVGQDYLVMEYVDGEILKGPIDYPCGAPAKLSGFGPAPSSTAN
jgi:serine/threonine protein kinase